MAQALRGLGLKILIQPATLEGWMGLTVFAPRFVGAGVAVLSGLALLLAIGGLFGATSYSVSRQRKELGIRVALGARRRQLLQMVLRYTAAVAGAGVGVGTGGRRRHGDLSITPLWSQRYRVDRAGTGGHWDAIGIAGDRLFLGTAVDRRGPDRSDTSLISGRRRGLVRHMALAEIAR